MRQPAMQPAQQQQPTQPRPQRRPQQASQGQEQTALEFFHKSSEGRFKKLALVVSPRGGVILRLSESVEGNVKSIAFALSRTELISLSREIEFYVMGVRKPTPTDDNGRTSIVEFFHANNNGQYKKLAVETFQDGGLALVLRQGERGVVPDSIVFALSRAEAIHLQEELRLLFYKRV